MNVEPTPTADSSCSSASSRSHSRPTMASPSPSPFCRSRSGFSSWWYSEKMRRCSASGMPRPVSATSMHTRPASGSCTEMRTRPASGVLDRVADEVSEHALEQREIDVHDAPLVLGELQAQPGLVRDRTELVGQDAEQPVQAHVARAALQHPASSCDRSSRPWKSPPSAAVDCCMRARISRACGSMACCSSAKVNSDSACTGWRRSWLAAARKRLLASTADSARSRCSRTSSSSAAFSRLSRIWSVKDSRFGDRAAAPAP